MIPGCAPFNVGDMVSIKRGKNGYRVTLDGTVYYTHDKDSYGIIISIDGAEYADGSDVEYHLTVLHSDCSVKKWSEWEVNRVNPVDID